MGSLIPLERRLESYKYALEEVKGRMYNGVCDSLNRRDFLWLRQQDLGAWFYFDVIRNYPEFGKHKPDNVDTSNYWWPRDKEGQQQRIKALQAAIKECEEALHKQQ